MNPRDFMQKQSAKFCRAGNCYCERHNTVQDDDLPIQVPNCIEVNCNPDTFEVCPVPSKKFEL